MMNNRSKKRIVLLPNSSKKRTSDGGIDRRIKIPRAMDDAASFMTRYDLETGFISHFSKTEVAECLEYMRQKFSKHLETNPSRLFCDKELPKPPSSNISVEEGANCSNVEETLVTTCIESGSLHSGDSSPMAICSKNGDFETGPKQMISQEGTPENISELSPAQSAAFPGSTSKDTITFKVVSCVTVSKQVIISGETRPSTHPVAGSSKCFENVTQKDEPPTQKKYIAFSARKGNAAILHKNVGKSFIKSNDLLSLILQWNPHWLSTQDETMKCAPICATYTPVKDCYQNELQYYNTYFPLHLLSIWLNITTSWNRTPPSVECVFESQVQKQNFVKISCSTDLYANWPRQEDIILCKPKKDCGLVKAMFGWVRNVVQECNSPVKNANHQDINLVQFSTRFEFFCVEKLNIPPKSPVYVQALCNIRVARLKNDALQNLNDAMKSLIVNPKDHISRVNFLTLPPEFSVNFPTCIKSILDSLTSPNFDVTVVEIVSEWNDISVLSQLTLDLVKQNHHVLIGLRDADVDSLLRLSKKLEKCNVVLAVKNDEVQLPKNFKKLTLEERLSKMRIQDVANECHVTLTLLPNVFMRCEFFSQVATEKKITCIIPDAHLYNETDTSSLLMYCEMKNVLLLGGNKRRAGYDEHSILRHFKYDVSLFRRLCNSKQ